MGDRANIIMKQNSFNSSNADIYLYSHWGGSELWQTLQNALVRRQRWDDDSYLTRIIFCEMVMSGDAVNGETGYGISTSPPDNDHPFLTVDVSKQRVIVEGGGSYTFEEYLELTKDPRS